jgi:hypothetical protein
LRKQLDVAVAIGEMVTLRRLADVKAGDLCVVTKFGDLLAVNRQHMSEFEESRFADANPASSSIVPATQQPASSLPSAVEQRAAFQIDAAMLQGIGWRSIALAPLIVPTPRMRM